MFGVRQEKGIRSTLNSKSISIKQQTNAQWHSDIAFEPVPASYTSLRLTQLPETGGGEFPTPSNLHALGTSAKLSSLIPL